MSKCKYAEACSQLLDICCDKSGEGCKYWHTLERRQRIAALENSGVKDGGFFPIRDFMVKSLKLGSNQLLVYALIYSFTHSPQGAFEGSCLYIAERCGCTEKTARNCLCNLEKDGLIKKMPHGKFNTYTTVH